MSGSNSGKSGDPIHLFTGRVVVSYPDLWWNVHDSQVWFERTYNSGSTYSGSLGHGWIHSYDRHIKLLGSQGVMEVDGRGVGTIFPPNGQGGFSLPPGRSVFIRKESDDTWTVFYPTGRIFGYRSDRKLAYIKEPSGDVFTLEYSPDGNLLRVIDPAGKALVFDVVGGLIRSVTAKNGVKVEYFYTADRRLAVAKDTRGKEYTYSYHPTTGDLTTIQLPTHDRVDYVYLSDTDRRVAKVISTSASGRVSETKLEYPEERKRIFIDAVGRRWTYEFDDTGREIKRTHPNERVRTLVRDSAGRITEATDSRGTRRWVYGDRGLVVSFTTVTGRRTTVERHPTTGRPLAWIHPDGTRVEKTFDSAGATILEKDALGRETKYVRNSHGVVTKIIDPLGRETTRTLDEDGNLLTETNAENQTTTYLRDDLGRVIGVTTPGGKVSRTEYVGMSLVKARIDSLGHRTEYDLDDLGRVISETGPTGARREYKWDRVNGLDVIIETRDPLGNVSKTIYNDAGQMVAQEDPLGRRTNYDLDAAGRVIKIRWPDGNFQLNRYVPGGCEGCPGAGLISETENARGAITKFFYDEEGRLIRTQLPDQSETSQTYDRMGRVQTRTQADGGVVQLVYDFAGQHIATIDQMGFITRTEHTRTGAVSKVIDARDKATEFGYDLSDRLVETTNALRFTTRQAYSPDSELILTVDAKGAETRFVPDLMGRVAETIDALGHSVKRTFDKVGNLLSLKDENSHEWTFEWDLLNRKTSETDPNRKTTRFGYNVASELVVVTFPDGSKWRYVRDLAGRVLRREHVRPDGTIDNVDIYTYDIVGNRLTAQNNAVKITSAYDPMDREIRRTVLYKRTGATRTLFFIYDIMGRRQLAIDGHNRVVRYDYDKLSRPTEITVGEPVAASRSLPAELRIRTYRFTWDATSNLTQVEYPNSTRTRRSFDAINRLTEMVHERVATGRPVKLLQSFAYKRDQVGNVTEIKNERSETFAYGYDAKDQLTRAVLPHSFVARLMAHDEARARRKKQKGNNRTGHGAKSGDGDDGDDADEDDEDAAEGLLRCEEITYKFDPAGNRVEESYGGFRVTSTYGLANELLTRGGVNYRYDDRGNQTDKILRSGRHLVFGYNLANQLVSFARGHQRHPHHTGVSGNAHYQVVERYTYSPDNERVTVEQVHGKKLTHFLWDGSRPIEEWHEVGHGSEKKEKGLFYLRDLGGQLLEQVRYWRHKGTTRPDPDGHGPDDEDDEDNDDDDGPSLRKLGHIRWIMPDHLGSTSLITNAHGRRLDRLQYGPWGEELGGGHHRSRFTYTGHQRERRTGYYYSMWRYLDPRAGRWTQRDPLFTSLGRVLYLYVSNSPNRAVDPQGLYELDTESFKQATEKERSAIQPLQSVLDKRLDYFTKESAPGRGLQKRQDRCIQQSTRADLLRILQNGIRGSEVKIVFKSQTEGPEGLSHDPTGQSPGARVPKGQIWIYRKAFNLGTVDNTIIHELYHTLLGSLGHAGGMTNIDPARVFYDHLIQKADEMDAFYKNFIRSLQPK